MQLLGRDDFGDSSKLTTSTTAFANSISCNFTQNGIALVDSFLIQLSYTLATISAQRKLCEEKVKQQSKLGNILTEDVNIPTLLFLRDHRRYRNLGKYDTKPLFHKCYQNPVLHYPFRERKHLLGHAV